MLHLMTLRTAGWIRLRPMWPDTSMRSTGT